MPREISWKDDRSKIHARVRDSSQTAYSRSHLESLFDLGTRGAQMLLELMPRQLAGTNALVQREDLLAWLNAAIDAEDLSAHLAVLRKNPPKPSRRKLRVQLPRQVEEGKLLKLRDAGIWIERGKLTLYFDTLDDCGSKMLQFAEAIQTAEFERRFCAPPPAALQRTPQQQLESADLTYLKATRKLTRAAVAIEKASAARDHSRVKRLLKIEASSFAELEAICSTTGRELDEIYRQAHRLIQGTLDELTPPVAMAEAPGTSSQSPTQPSSL